MPISKFKNGEWCEMTPEEIEQEKIMVAQKSEANEKARMERQNELSKQYVADIWDASIGENLFEELYEGYSTAGPRTLYVDISDGLMTCTLEDWSNNAYKRIDLLYIDTLAVRRLLNCEDGWLTENGVSFKREEE